MRSLNGFENLSDDEVERLLAHCGSRLWSLVVLALNTGLRAGELCALLWKNVDLEEGWLHIRPDSSWSPKTNRPATIPLNAGALEALRRLPHREGHVFLNSKGEPWLYHQMREELVAACGRAGVRRLGLHQLRHTFGTRLAKEGSKEFQIASLMRHRSMAMTRQYVHMRPEELRSEVDRLPGRGTDGEHSRPS